MAARAARSARTPSSSWRSMRRARGARTCIAADAAPPARGHGGTQWRRPLAYRAKDASVESRGLPTCGETRRRRCDIAGQIRLVWAGLGTRRATWRSCARRTVAKISRNRRKQINMVINDTRSNLALSLRWRRARGAAAPPATAEETDNRPRAAGEAPTSGTLGPLRSLRRLATCRRAALTGRRVAKFSWIGLPLIAVGLPAQALAAPNVSLRRPRPGSCASVALLKFWLVDNTEL